jgi:hypothetical protein
MSKAPVYKDKFIISLSPAAYLENAPKNTLKATVKLGAGIVRAYVVRMLIQHT